MLQANRLHPFEGQLIAGNQAGKHVKCSNQALPVYNDLVALAENGNYWALMVVRGIRGLTSGRLSMENVYIDQDKSVVSGPGVFYLVLPGVTASLEQTADGTYTLRGLKADTNYMQLQKRQQRPGLWRSDAGIESNTTTPVIDGSIKRKDHRVVVISEPAPNVTDEAQSATYSLVELNSGIRVNVEHSGFDQHYTPGDGRLIGLKPANEAIKTKASKELTQSAILLANTMYKAKNINGVLWFSHWGGSAVLTRALQILKSEKDVTLENHMIFLDKPTSNSSEALKLAEELKMLPYQGGKKTGLTPRQLLGNHFSSRLNREEWDNTTAFSLSAAGAITGILGLFGGVPAAGSIVGTAGAMYFVRKTVIAAKEQFSGKK